MGSESSERKCATEPRYVATPDFHTPLLHPLASLGEEGEEGDEEEEADPSVKAGEGDLKEAGADDGKDP